MDIHFFDSHLEIFISSLEPETVAKILRTIDLLQMFGHRLTSPHSKKINPRLFELRIRGKQEVRILYAFHKDGAVLLHGFAKKTRRIPQRELATAMGKLALLDRE